MPDIKILTEAELRSAVTLDQDAVECVEQAFELLAVRDVVMPPVLSFHIPDHNGEIDVKTAYVPGIDSFAVKMSPGFFDNPKIGLPSLNGLMVLFSSRTGLVEALLLDNGYLTDIRTAAAGAVAAKHLARTNARTAGIIGAGLQARLQLKALTLVRPIEAAVIWGRDAKKARICARDCADEFGIEISVATSIADVMAQSDLVVTTTPSTEPLITADMLRPGQHITAMGSDADYKCELAPEVIASVTSFVCDRQSQSEERGELRAAIAAGMIAQGADFAELGAIVAGQVTGRRDAADITVCDLTGTGVQDTAIATLAKTRAESMGAGTSFSS